VVDFACAGERVADCDDDAAAGVVGFCGAAPGGFSCC
jgi:hypothetical protein